MIWTTTAGNTQNANVSMCKKTVKINHIFTLTLLVVFNNEKSFVLFVTSDGAVNQLSTIYQIFSITRKLSAI